MSRSAAELTIGAHRSAGVRRPATLRASVLLLAMASALLCAIPAAAETSSSAPGFELTRGVQRALFRLQEGWLQWVSAVFRDNQAKVDDSLAAIEANARQLGMTRLLDFSLGASAMALQAASAGNFERAERALAAAERLDPGRSETSFARASVERRRGNHLAALGATWTGIRRLLGSEEGLVLAASLLFWLVAVLLVAGALFVLVEVAAKGSAVIADARSWLSRRVGPSSSWLLTVVLLLWPLLLPGGPLWLLLYWSALLWGYETRSERWVTAGIWVLVAVGPWAAARALDRVAISLSPPMRAIAQFAEGRLYGGLFADLDVLSAAIGDRPETREILADIHRTLGQWEEARVLYREVLAAEPRNVPVLINIGAYHFRKSDFALANDYFKQAVAADPEAVGALYNLSLSFSETYQFEESRQALAQAREIDGDRVDDWVKSPNPDRVLSFNGGLRRVEALESALALAWAKAPLSGEPSRRPRLLRGLITVALVAAFGIGLALLRGGRSYSEPTSWMPWRAGTVSRWVRAFFPALSQIELGEGGKAAGSLLALAAIALAPRLFTLGIDVPVLGGLPATLPSMLGVAGLLLYLGLCVRAELATED